MHEANSYLSHTFHKYLFKFHAKIIGEGVHSRDDNELFPPEDVQHFQEMHQGTSEAIARIMIALAGESAALAASLWGG